MIAVTAKFRIVRDDADRWLEISREFSDATRAEPGCMWFDWSRSLTDPTDYVLLAGFRDRNAGIAHVTAPHFKAAQRDLPPHLAETPRVISATVAQDGWAELVELEVRK